MKKIEKILALNRIIVVIFLMFSLAGMAWASPKYSPQQEINQVNIEKSAASKFKNPKNDSLVEIQCDKKAPYFILVDPTPNKMNVNRDATIRFFVLDDFTPKPNEWDKYGVNTDSIFVSIKTRSWQTNHRMQSNEIRLIDTIFKVYCEYKPPLPFDWTDSVTCSLHARDISYRKNPADTVYAFYTIRDIMAPELTPIYPLPEMVGVAVDSGIRIHGTDIGRGVDLKDIKLWINNSLVVEDTTITGTPWDFIIYYTPKSNWAYNDSISVKCLVHDLDGNGKTDTLRYWFKTEVLSDRIPPVIEVIRPQPKATGVDTTTDIVFYVTDAWSGVDLSTVELKVDNQVIPQDQITFINDGIGDTVKYQPVVSFKANSRDSVYLQVADFKKNWADTIYWFETDTIPILLDTILPEIIPLSPQPGDANVLVETNITFAVRDRESHPDTSKIFIDVGVPGELHKYIVRVDSVYCIFEPDSNFAYNDSVTVHIHAADHAKNPADTNYGFKTEPSRKDTIPPVIEPVDPLADADSVSVTTAIEFKVWDEGSGVNVDSVWLDIFSSQVPVKHGIPETTKTIEDTVYFRYQPVEPFAYNDSVTVLVYAADRVKNDTTLTYGFRTIPLSDTIPPVIEPVDPLADADSVSVTTAIEFKVWDTVSGVNVDSVWLDIFSSRVPVKHGIPETTKTIEDTVYFRYQPADSFAYNDSVTVEVHAADNAGNDTIKVYGFGTEPDSSDKTPPVIEPVNPIAGEDSVSVTTAIAFKVWDEGSGVNVDSVWLDIFSSRVPMKHGIPETTKTIEDTVYFRYQPVEPFAYNDSVTVLVYAADRVQNDTTLTYGFRTIPLSDTIPPVIAPVDPLADADSVSVTTAIEFKVWDDGSGVDINSVWLDISSSRVPVNHGIPETTKIIGDTVYFRYQPVEPFAYNDSVTVLVYAADRVKNDTTLTYGFRTIPLSDTIPPVIEPVDPLADADSVSVTTAIEFKVWDTGSGVDINSVSLIINGIIIKPPVKITIGDTIYFCYQPPTKFAFNDTVVLHIYAADKAGKDTTITYWFITELKLPDLYIVSFNSSPANHAFQKGEMVQLKAVIKCVNQKCPDTFAACFYLDQDSILCTNWINGITVDKDTTILCDFLMLDNRSHQIKVVVDAIPSPDGCITEEKENNNDSTITIFGDGAHQLIVRSNPFTPNQDGFNDEVKFDFEQFEVENPNLKIFDIHGKKIKEFGTDQKQGKAFFWNGLDETGREVLPGAYLYIFSDKSKALARGCVVVAR